MMTFNRSHNFDPWKGTGGRDGRCGSHLVLGASRVRRTARSTIARSWPITSARPSHRRRSGGPLGGRWEWRHGLSGWRSRQEPWVLLKSLVTETDPFFSTSPPCAACRARDIATHRPCLSHRHQPSYPLPVMSRITMQARLVYWAAVVVAAAAAAVVAATATTPHPGVVPTASAKPLAVRTAGPVSPGPPTILDAVKEDPDLENLAFVVRETGLEPVLGDRDTNFTLFAPTDSAILGLAQALGFNVGSKRAARDFILGTLADLNDKGDPTPLLTSILKFHVSNGSVPLDALEAAGQYEPLEGPRVRLGRDNRTLIDAAPSFANPRLQKTDILVSNGVIHTLSGVLLPLPLGNVFKASPSATPKTKPKPMESNMPAMPPMKSPPTVPMTIAELAGATPNLSLLVKALTAAKLVDQVADPAASLTVFAPTNDGFLFLARVLGYPNVSVDEAFPAIVKGLALLSEDKPVPLLRSILLYHLLPMKKGSAALLGKGFQTTVEGSVLNVLTSGVIEDQAPIIFNPSIVDADLPASNGVVHTISRTLWPLKICPSGSAAFCVSLGKLLDPSICRCTEVVDLGPFVY